MAAPIEEPHGKIWYVYILRCANGCLYTGIAKNVERRLATHNAGKGSAYVRAHRPAILVAFITAESRSAASKLECAVKGLTRTQKLALAAQWKTAQSMRMPPGHGKSLPGEVAIHSSSPER